MAAKKPIVAGVSVILVVGAVIGVIAGVRQISHSDGSSSSSNNLDFSTSQKAVSSLCSQTDYEDTCLSSLSSVAKNKSASIQDIVQTAFKAVMEQVTSVIDKSGSLGNATNNSTQKMAMEDCQDMLQLAIADLQASFSMVGESDLHTVNDRVAELMNWLSAVVSYQQSCLDGVTQPDMKNKMSNNMLNATQLTSNALAITSAISQIVTSFNISSNLISNSRRLLEASEVDKDGYPAWFSHMDRKLLAKQDNGNIKPNAVVAKDGTGQYKTIAAALAAYPKDNKGRYIIYIKAGIYDEYLTVTKDQVNVFMYGDGPRKTMITGRKNNRDGVSTYQTASFSVIGNGFIAKSMGFQNTAGPEGHQAVALRVQSDMSAFYNCRMDGYQDTLYVQTHRQFYRNCVISGTVDFIFGDSSTVIQNSLIIIRKPMDNQQNTVTAHGRSESRETTGLVIQNCRIMPEQKLYTDRFKIPTFLGRPWKEYSRTVIMESTMGDFIQPAGWMPWQGTFALNTLYYAEYANRGPGASTNKRVNWRGFHVITDKNQALQFTAGPFIQGGTWLKNTGVPYFLGLKN